MRQKLLVGGDTNSGKTTLIIQLAASLPDRQVWVFDAEGDVSMTLEDMGLELPNLTIRTVTPDWIKFTQDYNEAKATLTEQDWCCFDMLGVFWDLSQNAFSRSVYGESPAEHIVKLRSEAKKADFGGFDGLTDWTVIKRMHNEDIFDDAVRWSSFNVLGTTSLTDFSPKEKVPTTGTEGLMAKEFGKKLEGEKHNKFRFREIAIIYHDLKDKKYKFKVVKMKGKPLEQPLQEYDFTGLSFIEAYAEARGITL